MREWRSLRARGRTGKTAFLVVLLLGFHARPGSAEESGAQKLDGKGATVAIVGMEKCCGAEAWPEAEKMTETEFLSLHYKVVTVYGKASEDVGKMGELMEIADEEKAVCTVRITRKPEEKIAELDAWIWDQATGKTAFRHLVMESLSDADGPSVVALRVVELLRAALMEPAPAAIAQDEDESLAGSPPLELEDLGAAEGGDGAEKPVVTLKASPRKRGYLGLRVGFMGIGSPGGTGGLGAVEVALRWNPLAMLALELGGFVSVVGRDIRHLDASASFDVAAVRVWAMWEFMNRARVRFGVGVGGGVLLAWTKGTAPEKYWVRTETGHAACFGGGLQMAVVLTRYLWLRTGFSVGLTLPDEITVVFAGEKVAAFGRPLLEGFLGLEGRIP